jgi:hypothetical protein
MVITSSNAEETYRIRILRSFFLKVIDALSYSRCLRISQSCKEAASLKSFVPTSGEFFENASIFKIQNSVFQIIGPGTLLGAQHATDSIRFELF